ncbi:Fe-S osidoreductase [Candidatus Nitromaritima sp. SCGC AAA799-A02]|nr:Fe-S osidoreductase [Candidatus Nitromaritima sp. SCGC AAA799-A02]
MTEKIDVLLINPGDHQKNYQNLSSEFSAIEPPAFAGLFATYLLQKEGRVAIYDIPALQVTAEEAVTTLLKEFDPRLVVIVVYGLQPSASTQNMGSAGKIARLLKQARPPINIMMTGTHPSALPERTLQEEAIDFVCEREGPETIYLTCEALKSGSKKFSEIPSLWWREGESIRSPRTHQDLITHLDEEMPGIAWDYFPMERYRAHNWHCFDHLDQRTPYASIHTSLGCPYHCHFCCINAPFGKSSYRLWQPQTVVREINHLVTRYGVKNIKFVDEMFVLNREHVLGICDLLIERDYDLNIWAYSRIDTVQDNMLDKLKAAGFRWLALGIESGTAEVRNGASKKFSDREIGAVVRRIKDAGINIIGNYIFGLPKDNLESMQATLDLALDLNCEFANFYSAMAYPGSQLYQMAIEQNLELPENWGGYSQHAYNVKPLASEYCTSAEILQFRDMAFTRYFTHKPYLDMVQNKFGESVVDHIKRMVSIPLSRELLKETQVAN